MWTRTRLAISSADINSVVGMKAACRDLLYQQTVSHGDLHNATIEDDSVLVGLKGLLPKVC